MTAQEIECTTNPSDHSSAVLPTDFDEYLVWACDQLDLPPIVISRRIVVDARLSSQLSSINKKNQKGKSVAVMHTIGSTISQIQEQKEVENMNPLFGQDIDADACRLITSYQNDKDLVHLTFKNTKINNHLLDVIGMFVLFHPLLRGVTVSCPNVEPYVVSQLHNLVLKSNITEVYFDDSFNGAANYDILLGDYCQLQVLSLARCKLGDDIVEKIGSKLVYPFSAAKSLAVLNLATNRLTDKTAMYFAKILKSNKKLTYLNLTDNWITSVGAIELFKAFLPFPFSKEDSEVFNKSQLDYFLNKKYTIMRIFTELQSGEVMDSTNQKDKQRKKTDAFSLVEKSLTKSNSMTDKDNRAAIMQLNINMLKAMELADKECGLREEVFADTSVKDGVRYGIGNTSLMYLNIMYNNIEYDALGWLLKVLEYQKTIKSKGLLNVRIDGNPLPVSCIELYNINMLLDSNLHMKFTQNKMHVPAKKRK